MDQVVYFFLACAFGTFWGVASAFAFAVRSSDPKTEILARFIFGLLFSFFAAFGIPTAAMRGNIPEVALLGLYSCIPVFMIRFWILAKSVRVQ